MNLGVMTTTTQQLVNDAKGTRYAGRYTFALNLAQQQFAMDSKCTFKDMAVQTIVAAQATYPLPSDFMWEKFVLVNGLLLPPISRMELARTHTGSRWDTVTGTPRAYVVDPDVARQDILLYPIPTSNENGQDLQMTYFSLPTDMVNSTDIPLNGNTLLAPYHIGICAWAGWFLLEGEGATEAIVADQKGLLQIYNDSVSQASDQFKNTVSEPLRMRGVRNYTTSISGT